VRVLYTVICGEASAREDGRLDILGVFHQLYAPGFPAQQDEMVLVTVLEWNEGETDRQTFRIDLLDPTQTPVLTISGHSDVSPTPTGEAPPQTRLIMPLQDIVFPVAGGYLFQLHVGEAKVALGPLYLIEGQDEG
jgi:hypothetical protein